MARSGAHAVLMARRLTQIAFAGLVVAIGVRFGGWAFAHLAGRMPDVPRPPGVEGFLPISALMSLRVWLAGGGVHPVHPAGLAILLAILLMSLLVAKSFCSHLCPVGTVSEGLGRLGTRLMGQTWKLPRWLDLPLRSLKYLLLAFFVWATWAAMSLPAVLAFLDSPYNRVADVKMLLFFADPSRLTVAVLGVLVVGSILIRDPWCRYLCPYGALLGLLGRLAPLKVTRDERVCTDCRSCSKVCPARLPVHRMARVASVECTSCFDCAAACPVDRCLYVALPHPRSRRWAFRPAAAAVLAVAVYLTVTAGFRLTGRWQGCVDEAEYERRMAEISSPLYTHVGGRARSEPRPPDLVESHAGE